MADENNHPVSSPPENVIHVASLVPSSPTTEEFPLSDHTNQSSGKRTTAAPKRAAKHDEDGKAEESSTNDFSDEVYQPATQKRKVLKSRKSHPTKKPRRMPAAARKPAKDKKWEAPFVYTDSKSPLAQADLRAILLHPRAWEVLTPQEKQEVLAKFPDETHILNAGTEAARPNLESMRNDDNFRHDCARYCENIELGRHDEEWLSQAWTAHERHKRGEFEAFLQSQFEEDWEVELPKKDEPDSHELSHRFQGDPSQSSEQEVPESTEQPQPVSANKGQESQSPIHITQEQLPPVRSDVDERKLQNGDEKVPPDQTPVTGEVALTAGTENDGDPAKTREEPSHEENGS